MNRLLLSLVFLFLPGLAHAEVGVMANEIVIGIVNDQSGPSDALANKSYNAGAKVVFDNANKVGGIFRRLLKVNLYDDAYDPEKTAGLTKKAIETDKVFLLMNYTGTPTTKAAMPLIEKTQTPFLFPRTGDTSIRVRKPNVYHLRASYEEEVVALIKAALVDRKLKRLSIVAQADGFGSIMKSSVLAAFQKFGMMDEVRKRGSAFVSEGSTQRNVTNVDEAFAAVAKGEPDVVLLAVPPGPAAMFLKKAAAEKKKWLFLAASNNGALPEGPTAEAQGMLISQVLPLLESSQLPIVKQFRADMESANEKTRINSMAFEGYLNALLTVQAIERAGANLTRESFLKALEAKPFVVGGLSVEFSPTTHQATLPVTVATVKGTKLVE